MCATSFNASVFGLQTAENFDVNICTDNIHAKNNPNYASVCCTVVIVCLFFLLYLLLSEHLGMKNTCNLFILIKSPGRIINFNFFIYLHAQNEFGNLTVASEMHKSLMASICCETHINSMTVVSIWKLKLDHL